MFGKDKKWDLEKMEYLRRNKHRIKKYNKFNIETIEIIARKYRTDK
jgi:hypothetical protein